MRLIELLASESPCAYSLSGAGAGTTSVRAMAVANRAANTPRDFIVGALGDDKRVWFGERRAPEIKETYPVTGIQAGAVGKPDDPLRRAARAWAPMNDSSRTTPSIATSGLCSSPLSSDSTRRTPRARFCSSRLQESIASPSCPRMIPGGARGAMQWSTLVLPP
jgi:hypothetical protein